MANYGSNAQHSKHEFFSIITGINTNDKLSLSTMYTLHNGEYRAAHQNHYFADVIWCWVVKAGGDVAQQER